MLAGIFATAVGTVAVGRHATKPLGRIRLIAGVLVAQLAFHHVFSLLGTGARVTASGTPHHPLFRIAEPDASGTATSALDAGSIGMLLAHLLAAGVTALYLRHLERQVWAVLYRFGGFLLRALGIRMRLPVAGMPRLATFRVRVLAPAVVLGSISRRGPPAIACA